MLSLVSCDLVTCEGMRSNTAGALVCGYRPVQTHTGQICLSDYARARQAVSTGKRRKVHCNLHKDMLPRMEDA